MRQLTREQGVATPTPQSILIVPPCGRGLKIRRRNPEQRRHPSMLRRSARTARRPAVHPVRAAPAQHAADHAQTAGCPGWSARLAPARWLLRPHVAPKAGSPAASLPQEQRSAASHQRLLPQASLPTLWGHTVCRRLLPVATGGGVAVSLPPPPPPPPFPVAPGVSSPHRPRRGETAALVLRDGPRPRPPPPPAVAAAFAPCRWRLFSPASTLSASVTGQKKYRGYVQMCMGRVEWGGSPLSLTVGV